MPGTIRSYRTEGDSFANLYDPTNESSIYSKSLSGNEGGSMLLDSLVSEYESNMRHNSNNVAHTVEVLDKARTMQRTTLL